LHSFIIVSSIFYLEVMLYRFSPHGNRPWVTKENLKIVWCIIVSQSTSNSVFRDCETFKQHRTSNIGFYGYAFKKHENMFSFNINSAFIS